MWPLPSFLPSAHSQHILPPQISSVCSARLEEEREANENRFISEPANKPDSVMHWNCKNLPHLDCSQTGSVTRVMLMEALQEITSQFPAPSITLVNYKRTQWLIGSGPGVQ